MVLGDQVDTGVSAPAARPVIPQPHPAKLVRVDRVVRQEPVADVRKLHAPPNLLGVQPAQQITERSHANETKGRGLAGPPSNLEVPSGQAASSSVRYRYKVARLIPRYLAMSLPV
jgi:hypothetical protein